MNAERPTPRSRFRPAARSFAAALLAAVALSGSARAEPEMFDLGFDDFGDGEIEIINGKIVARPRAPIEEKKAEPDPAGDQILELTDGSQLHGRLVALGKNEVVWERADATDLLTFTPQEVRRLVLGASTPIKDSKANATLKLPGSDWLAAELSTFKDGKFTVQLGAGTPLEIPREKVEWLALSPKLPPDAYEGPFGLMGLAGWDTGREGGNGWEYADGALVARNSSSIQRRFEALPERIDIQFTAGDGGANNRALAFSMSPNPELGRHSPGSCYLQFQGNTVSLNLGTQGGGIKSMSAQIPAEKDEKKLTRYRFLYDRKDGRLLIFINGKQLADWDLPETKSPPTEGTFVWIPNYWNSNMAWTLSQVRLQPWDGSLTPDPKDEEKGKDLLQTGQAPRQGGALQEISAETVKFEGADVARKDPIFLRLAAPPAVEPPAGAVARVWLASRGEFDVTGIGFRDGVLKVRTAFGGDISLPAGTVRALEFPHKAGQGTVAEKTGNDTLIFKSGDQLRGTLLSASHNQPLRWKPVKGDKPVEFSPESLAGVLLGSRTAAEKPAAAGAAPGLTAVARFHNGDWLPGRVQSLDAQSVGFKTFGGTELKIQRPSVKTLYFGSTGEAPVWDGASDRESWLKGLAIPNYMNDMSTRTRKDEKKPSPWRYLDGTFTLAGVTSNRYGNGPSLGRILEAMPEKVDISFEMSTSRDPANYVFQLFFDENKQGIMIQGGWDSAYIYDMAPRPNGGVGFNNQPQQLDFSEKVGSGGNRRHFRFLADRRTSQLWMYVNGHHVGTLNRRSGGENRKTGQGLSIFPQAAVSKVSISNLWIAPWSGALPEVVGAKKKPAPEAEAAEGEEAPKADNPKGQAAAAPKADAPKPAEPAAAVKVDAAKVAVAKVAAQIRVLINGRVVNGGGRTNTEEKPAAQAVELTEDSVALANGDETRGTVLRTAGDKLVLKCDVGEIEVPMQRAVLVDFAGKTPVADKGGIRLRFAGKGALTVQNLRFENDKVICQSPAVGELTFPLSQLTEIIFHPSAPAVAAKAPIPATPAAAEPAGAVKVR